MQKPSNTPQSAGHSSAPPPRTEPRHSQQPAGSGHIKGVKATSGGLIRATLGAAAAAAVILALFWLPAEYGIDPTGVGRALGLTEMGEIKQQLYAEDAADAAARAPVPTPAANGTAERLDVIEARLATIIAALKDGEEAPAPVAQGTTVIVPVPAEYPAAPLWQDEVSYTLAPGEGVEVKLVMDQDAVAEFEWYANGAVLNHDTHGDGSGQKITYERGRGVPGQQSTLTAAFSGNHGWFWRNRTDVPVTFTLRTRGDYTKMRAP